MRFLRAHGARFVGLGFILSVAFALRVYRLGSLSFWYDEVVTMTLARASGLHGVISKLDEIDATRAPLHPILLHAWVRLFGETEFAARAFSVACGVLTVLLIARIAGRLFDSPSTAFYAGWLAAISPMLIVYSREARMYGWLVLVTCAAWDALFSLREGAPNSRETAQRSFKLFWYGICFVALGYSHPLGLFMGLALVLASAIQAEAYGFEVGGWLIVHLSVATVIAVWIGRYLDHPPELILGRLPLRYLLGTPIGWTGGNFLTLGLCLMVVCAGLFSLQRQVVNESKGRFTLNFERPATDMSLLIWLVLPVTVLWLYSRLSHPIFGPARYSLFCAPPYLILMARGMARLPRWIGVTVAIGAAALATTLIPSQVFAPDLKADWRAAEAALSRRNPQGDEPVIVTSNDRKQNLEIVTARYYLRESRRSIALPASPRDLDALQRNGQSISRFWLSSSVHDGWLSSEFPSWIPLRRDAQVIDVNGLRFIAVEMADLPKFSTGER